MRHATINLNRKGVSRIDDAVAFLRNHNIHIAALPEVHVNQTSAPGYVRQWKHHGFHAALAECGPDAHSCVGLVSSEPFKQVQLCMGPGRVRHVAGLFTACVSSASIEDSGQRSEGLLIIAFYGQSGNHIAAEAQIEDVIAAAEASGFRWVCVGDFNLIQQEGVLGNAGVNGAIHLLDDCAAGAPLPGTGPSGTRRIDFGISQWSIRATQVSHFSTDLSDHTVVVYNIPWNAPTPYVGPRRLSECFASEDDVARRYIECDSEPFQEACEAGKYEEAWAWLSYHAEASLCEHQQPACVHRAEHWEPHQLSRGTKTKWQEGPLSELRRLLRRLEELQVSGDECLLRSIVKSLRSVRGHFPDLPYVPQAELRTLLPWVRDKVQSVANQEREDAFKRWRAKLRFDAKKQRTFVKDKVNRQLEYEKARLSPEQAATFGSTHPAIAVEEHSAKWIAKWSKEVVDRGAAIDSILAEVPRVDRVQCDIRFTGIALRRAASVMADKAPGPDSWQAFSLLKLPISWWDRLAHLWQLVWQSGSVPESWAKATVVLIRKQDGAKTRPITLTQAAWRIGARVIAQSLQQWTDKWAAPWDQGGIGARSVEGALYQLQAALRRGVRRVLLLDVAAYFDSISSQLVTKTLEHLGAPLGLAPLLCSCYQQALRIFSFDGMLANRWRKTCLGIPQGCPLSPCVAAAIAHIWAAYVRAGCPSVGITAFMDDRTCWLEPNASIADLHTAVERSNAVDRAFGFELSPEKCVVASLSDDVDALAFAQSQGFKNSTCMELLGVRLQFNGCGAPLRFSLRKVLLRLRAIGWTQAPTPQRAALMRSLVVPCYSWAATWLRSLWSYIMCKVLSQAGLRISLRTGLSFRVFSLLLGQQLMPRAKVQEARSSLSATVSLPSVLSPLIRVMQRFLRRALQVLSKRLGLLASKSTLNGSRRMARHLTGSLLLNLTPRISGVSMMQLTLRQDNQPSAGSPDLSGQDGLSFRPDVPSGSIMLSNLQLVPRANCTIISCSLELEGASLGTIKCFFCLRFNGTFPAARLGPLFIAQLEFHCICVFKRGDKPIPLRTARSSGLTSCVALG